MARKYAAKRGMPGAIAANACISSGGRRKSRGYFLGNKRSRISIIISRCLFVTSRSNYLYRDIYIYICNSKRDTVTR